jgi:hypothetical protein
MKNQYSDRRARPEKPTYWLRQLLMAAPNDTDPPRDRETRTSEIGSRGSWRPVVLLASGHTGSRARVRNG